MSFKSEKYITPKDGGDEAAKEAARNEAWGYVPEDSHVYENANAFIDDTNRPSNEEEADAARIDDFADDASEMYGNEKLGDLAIMARDAMRSDDVSTAKEIQNAIYSRIEKMAADGKLSTEAAVSHMENLSAIIEDNTERLFENDDLDKRVQFDNPVPVKAEIEDFGPAKISEASDSFKNTDKPGHLLITDDETPAVAEASANKRDKFLPGAVEDAMDKVPAPEQPEDGESEAARNAKEAAKEAAKAVDERDTAQAAADAAAAESATADASGSAEAQPDDNDEHAPATDEQETGKKRFKRIRKLGRGALNFALGNGKKGIALASSMRQKHQAKKAAKIDAILAKDKELIADDDKKTPLTGRPSFSYRMGATSHPIVAQYKEAKKAYKKDKREAKPSLYDKFVDRFADKVPKQEDKHEEVPQYVDDAPTGSFPAQKPDQQPVYTNVGDGQSIDYADQTTQPLPNNVPVSGEQAGSTDGTRAA